MDLADRMERVLCLETQEVTSHQIAVEAAPNVLVADAMERRSNYEKVREYLLANGPSERVEIMKATGIPVGSIGSVLANGFQTLGPGKWGLRESQ